MNRNQQAAVYFTGLRLGITNSEEIIEWADSVIQEEPKPKYDYIELSLVDPKRKDDILSILHRLKQPCEYFESLKLFTPTLLRAIREKEISPRQAGRMTYEYTRTRINEIPDGYWPFFSFDDYFDMAEDGTYGIIEEVEQSYINFLEEISEQDASGQRR